MSDSTILYVGIVCFSLIILGFVITVREFRKIAETGNSGKRQPQVVYRT